MHIAEEIVDVAGRQCHFVTNGRAPACVIVKPLGPFEWRCLKEEYEMTVELTQVPFVMAAFDVEDMDSFRQQDWETRDFVVSQLVPFCKKMYGELPLVIGGYSLGGLFALWCSTTTDVFAAVAAGSPSLWADWWGEYAEGHQPKAQFVYLSVGDTEDKTKKKPFCMMGSCVEAQHERNKKTHGSDSCMLEWNHGGHFADIEMRKAKGWAWCLDKVCGN